MKTCIICGISKSLSEFTSTSGCVDVSVAICNKCKHSHAVPWKDKLIYSDDDDDEGGSGGKKLKQNLDFNAKQFAVKQQQEHAEQVSEEKKENRQEIDADIDNESLHKEERDTKTKKSGRHKRNLRTSNLKTTRDFFGKDRKERLVSKKSNLQVSKQEIKTTGKKADLVSRKTISRMFDGKVVSQAKVQSQVSVNTQGNINTDKVSLNVNEQKESMLATADDIARAPGSVDQSQSLVAKEHVNYESIAHIVSGLRNLAHQQNGGNTKTVSGKLFNESKNQSSKVQDSGIVEYIKNVIKP